MIMAVKTLIVVAVSLCIFSFQCLVTTKADDALIKRICDATSAAADCTACLKSDPSSATANEIGLTEICMVCAANDINLLYEDTIRFQASTSDPTMKDALNFCLDQFETAHAKIDEASGMVHRKDFNAATGFIKYQILLPVFSCPDHIKSKGLSVPDFVSNEIGSVTRGWKIVLDILGYIK